MKNVGCPSTTFPKRAANTAPRLLRSRTFALVRRVSFASDCAKPPSQMRRICIRVVPIANEPRDPPRIANVLPDRAFLLYTGAASDFRRAQEVAGICMGKLSFFMPVPGRAAIMPPRLLPSPRRFITRCESSLSGEILWQLGARAVKSRASTSDNSITSIPSRRMLMRARRRPSVIIGPLIRNA